MSNAVIPMGKVGPLPLEIDHTLFARSSSSQNIFHLQFPPRSFVPSLTD